MAVHYYYAEAPGRGIQLDNLGDLDHRGWLNRTVGAALGSGAMRLAHLNQGGVYNPVPEVPRFSELSPQMAYVVVINVEDKSLSGVQVPKTSPDTARHGLHWLSTVPEVPLVYRDETGLLRFTGLVFADHNTPEALSKQLGLEPIRQAVPLLPTP